jgi:hypothetical protein
VARQAGGARDIKQHQQLGNEALANPPATNFRHAEWLGLELLLSVVEVVSIFSTPGERAK